MRRYLLSIVVVFLCWLVAPAQTDFASLDAFRTFVLKGEDRLSVEARGDLNGDGLDDWAGVVHRQKSGASPTYQLYVLLLQPKGGYQLAQTSREQEIAGMGCCWVEDLRISRSSIYIQNNAKTATTMEAATHQFKLYKGEWRLIGIRIYYTDHSSDVSTDTDMNVLTGAIIERTRKGDGKATVSRRHKKFGVYLLKDFDFLNTFGME
jgi:hypothetical protein